MKTIEIIRYTGEMEEKEVITQDEAGKDITQMVETPITEKVKEYTCEDGDENSLLTRARLTAELHTRDKEGDFTARIKA